MQDEQDEPESRGNIHAKLDTDIRFKKWKIAEVRPLVVDESQPLAFMDALEQFGEENGFEHGEYAGLLRAER